MTHTAVPAKLLQFLCYPAPRRRWITEKLHGEAEWSMLDGTFHLSDIVLHQSVRCFIVYPGGMDRTVKRSNEERIQPCLP